MIKKYRKKPVVIEAIQVNFGYTNVLEIKDFIGNSFVDTYAGKIPYIETLEGNMYISDGDYIIKGIQGEFYPCKPDIFEATYESVKDTDFERLLTAILSVFPKDIDKKQGSVLYDLFAPFVLAATSKPSISPTIILNNPFTVKEVNIEKIAQEIAKRLNEELSKTSTGLY